MERRSGERSGGGAGKAERQQRGSEWRREQVEEGARAPEGGAGRGGEGSAGRGGEGGVRSRGERRAGGAMGWGRYFTGGWSNNRKTSYNRSEDTR